MEPISKEQIKLIHVLLPEEIKRDTEMKGDLVMQFTGDTDKRSTKDLDYLQANELIYFLQTGNMPTNAAWASFDASNKRHRYILHLCHQVGWQTYDRGQGRMVADLEALGGWIRKYGYLHKPLLSYSDKELGKLINQLELTVLHELNKTQDP